MANVLDPGCVAATLRWEGRTPYLVVASSRPDVAALFRGRDADAVRRWIPALHSVCRKAQGLAADLALGAARGVETGPFVDPAAAKEAAREHAWRLLLDWPEQLGSRPDLAEFATLTRAIAASQPCAWPIPGWIDDLDRTEHREYRRMLPVLDARESAGHWLRLDAPFAKLPTLQGTAAETGPLARADRDPGGGVLARVLARAWELQRHMAGKPTLLGRASAAALAPGVGRSTVETARGLLMHEVELADDRIERYTVVAPTEWNFHPDGILADCLSAGCSGGDAGGTGETESADSTLRCAARWILALDPCVAWTVEVSGSVA